MKKAIKWILLAIFALAVVLVFVSLWKHSRPKQVQYEWISVTTGDIRKTTIVTGDIEPRCEVAIKPQINGIIAELLKQAGDPVKAGDPIARIQVITEAASLSSAESRVRLAEKTLQNQIKVFQRDSALYLQKVISQEEYDKSYLQYLTCQEDLQAAEDNLSIIRDGMTRSAGESGNTNTIIRSTISGRILDIPVKVGNSVTQLSNFGEGTTIATVADMQDLLFVGKIDETEVGKLKEGMPMELLVGALNDCRFAATLEYIAPKGVSNNGAMMFEIKGAAHIPDSVVIRSGYSANAEIVLQERQQVLILPEETLEMEGNRSFVQVLTDETTKTVERREVVTGLSDGMHIEIVSGLKEGDVVRGNSVNMMMPQQSAQGIAVTIE
ncbi:MAG: efflux RND transporter periplasmic adaptor subunit [Paludibacteraceae bacterium]|nr:efflux RND transporter periplasmic adaptor subunit [Paludibacteraceae bacterium]